MTVAVTPRGERWYVTEGDKKLDADQQTWWRIRDLTERERMKLMDEFVVSVDKVTGEPVLRGSGTRTYLTIKAGLVGVCDDHPLRDGDGKMVPFDTDADGRVSDEFLARITYAEKREIADSIVEATHLSPEDVEKPEPSPTDS